MIRHMKLLPIILMSSVLSANSTHDVTQGNIHDAIKNGKIGSVQNILKNNPDEIHKQNMYGYYPLHYAVLHGKHKIIGVLVRAGSDVQKSARVIPPEMMERLEKRNENQLSEQLKQLKVALRPIDIATIQGHLNICKQLVAQGASLQHSEDGITLLHRAAGSLHPHIVSWLLENGLNANAQAKNGFTPLLAALSHPIMFQDKKLPQKQLRRSNRMVKVVRQLLKHGANVNIETEETNNPVYLAISHNVDPQIVKLLVRHGAKTTIREDDNLTPLHMAIEAQAHDVPKERVLQYINILLKHNADPNARADGNITPLHLATLIGDIDLVRTLLRKRADPRIATDPNLPPQRGSIPENATAIDIAQKMGYTEIADVLEQHSKR